MEDTIKIIGRLTKEEQENIANAIAEAIDRKVYTFYNDWNKLVMITIEEAPEEYYQEPEIPYVSPVCLITNHTTTYESIIFSPLKKLQQSICLVIKGFVNAFKNV